MPRKSRHRSQGCEYRPRRTWHGYTSYLSEHPQTQHFSPRVWPLRVAFGPFRMLFQTDGASSCHRQAMDPDLTRWSRSRHRRVIRRRHHDILTELASPDQLPSASARYNTRKLPFLCDPAPARGRRRAAVRRRNDAPLLPLPVNFPDQATEPVFVPVTQRYPRAPLRKVGEDASPMPPLAPAIATTAPSICIGFSSSDAWDRGPQKCRSSSLCGARLRTPVRKADAGERLGNLPETRRGRLIQRLRR